VVTADQLLDVRHVSKRFGALQAHVAGSATGGTGDGRG
jgi:hypothetical protein